jgi:hypothetical protein
MNKATLLYFGCWVDAPGHYLWGLRPGDGRWHHVYREERQECPWSDGELDGGLLKELEKALDEYQPEGAGVLVHLQGWTCFSFWNRRFDKRGNSNSAFILKGELPFTSLITYAKQKLPGIFEGLKGLTLVKYGTVVERFQC